MPWHVVALRTGDRFAKGLRTAPRDALIADSTPAEQRGFAFSFHRGLDHLGAAVGPLLAAGLLAVWDGKLRLVFALATVPALAGVAVVLWRVRETGVAGPREEARRGVRMASASDGKERAALPRALRAPLVAVFLFGLGNASDAFLLLRASQLGMDALALTLLWSGFHIVKWACSAPSGRLVDRLGPGRPLLVGWLLYAAVYAGFAYANGIASMLALLVFYALYYGLTEGAERTLVTALAGDAGRGTVLGAYHLASGAGLFLASLLFGIVWERASARAAFLVGAALALGATALLAAALSSSAPVNRKSAA
jgi:MFS family permease